MTIDPLKMLAEFAQTIGPVIDEWPVELRLIPGGQVAVTIIAGLLPAEDRVDLAVDSVSDAVVLRRLFSAACLSGQGLNDARESQVALVEDWSARWSLAMASTNVSLRE